MKITEFIEEIKADLSDYDGVGLIDDISIFRWVLTTLSDFGQNIQDLHQITVKVKKGRALLPDNFSSLKFAGLCEFEGIYENDIIISDRDYQWIERDERIIGYNDCSPCCYNKEDKVITQRVVSSVKLSEARFKEPIPLKLGKYIQRDSCASDCANFGIKSDLEITIREKTLRANFDEGTIYMIYYGTPVDEEGEFIIPDIGHSALIEYLEYFVKSKIFEKMLANNDATNITQLFQYYVQKSREAKDIAYGVTKFLRLTPESFNRLKMKNRRNYQSKQGRKTFK